jgi:uncharacterized DUF497 family protein
VFAFRRGHGRVGKDDVIKRYHVFDIPPNCATIFLIVIHGSRKSKMHPRDTEGFDWNEGNEQELVPHRITDREAEEVFLNGPVWVRNKRSGSGDYKMIGYTNGGRALTLIVVVQQEARLLRVITGWDCTTGERTRYL